ncbi:carbamoyltransferase HypF [Limnothrix sp. FACHB-881]|nr:carbamoyltransferase HypF [Limnothrix sp. FACHB-881]MBD2634019.1 carbamoyltransferase HypF [Limnothrix sp. FACHB-881]
MFDAAPLGEYAMASTQDEQSLTMRAEEIRVVGVVQGVGFRPTVYRLAIECGLMGSVANDGVGVVIRIAGYPDQIDVFLQRLYQEKPPLSRIDTLIRTPIALSELMEPGLPSSSGNLPAVSPSESGALGKLAAPEQLPEQLPAESATESATERLTSLPTGPSRFTATFESGSDDLTWDEHSIALGQQTAMEIQRNRQATRAHSHQGQSTENQLQGPRCPLHLRPEHRSSYTDDPVAESLAEGSVVTAETAQPAPWSTVAVADDGTIERQAGKTYGEVMAMDPREGSSVGQGEAGNHGRSRWLDRGPEGERPSPIDPEHGAESESAGPLDQVDPVRTELNGHSGADQTDLGDRGNWDDPRLAVDGNGAAAPASDSLSRSRLDQLFDSSPTAAPSEPSGDWGARSGIRPDVRPGISDRRLGDRVGPSDQDLNHGPSDPKLDANRLDHGLGQDLAQDLHQPLDPELSNSLAEELAELLEPAIDRLRPLEPTEPPTTPLGPIVPVVVDDADPGPALYTPLQPPTPIVSRSAPLPVSHRSQALDLSSAELLGRSPLSFRILESQSGPVRTQIAPDTATCAACLRDLHDPDSRYYHYPFVNCTHCGPRLTVIRSLPYDRVRTSMVGFQLCPDCQRDYDNPGDRRFHAQPTACPECGPRIWFERPSQQRPIVKDEQAIAQAAEAIRQGAIVAIKGLGGIHLACDATQEAVVQRLRARKHRPHKPLAVMARNLESVRQFCVVSDHERSLLLGGAAPIVLLTIRDPHYLAPSVAPDMTEAGVMLPYSPLHHLLMSAVDRPIVLTSGNRAGNPQCIDNHEAHLQLQSIADAFLLHNRSILNRVDDSVVRVLPTSVQVIRRSRGYAPSSINLPPGLTNSPPILALGSDLKNTICLSRDGQAILSPHLGDLDSPACLQAYSTAIADLRNLFDHRPSAIAVDLHPDGQAVKVGESLAKALEVPLLRIQHHHAHIAACLADNQWGFDRPPVLGIALDGFGWGSDGTVWGGELLWTTYEQYHRVGALWPARLLGGNRAAQEPWRNLYAQFHATGLLDRVDSEKWFAQKPLNLLTGMAQTGFNSPWSSSCGRLFDAVAAFLGCAPDCLSYEGQAAIALENLARQAWDQDQQAYPIELRSESLLWLHPQALWEALILDRALGLPEAVMALRFHRGLAQALVQAAQTLKQQGLHFGAIACGGGVFQNRLLLQCLEAALMASNLHDPLLLPQQVPVNDGGLALGQTAIAAAWLQLGHV